VTGGRLSLRTSAKVSAPASVDARPLHRLPLAMHSLNDRFAPATLNSFPGCAVDSQNASVDKERAERRHLRALKTLADVRKLNLPPGHPRPSRARARPS